MRIALLTQNFPAGRHQPIVSGAVKNPYYLTRALIDLGVAVDVVSFDHPPAESASTDLALSSLTRVPGRGLKLFLRTLWFNAATLFHVRRLARRVDLIQSHHPDVCVQVALLKRLNLVKAPLVVKAHGTSLPEFESNRFRGLRGRLLALNSRVHLALHRFAFAQADLVLSSSAYQVRELVELYRVPPEKVRVVYNGADPDPEAVLGATDAARLDTGDTWLLFVGRVVRKKGADYFLELVEALGERLPDLRGLLVLGRSDQIEDRAWYREKIEPRAEPRRFTRLFDVPDDSLQAVYRRCRALIVPSRDYESIPTVVYEAHAAGIPVYATYDWGIPEVVRPEYALSGDLASDVRKLAERLDDSEPARDSAEPPPSCTYRPERFTWRAIGRQYLDLYRGLGLEGAPADRERAVAGR